MPVSLEAIAAKDKELDVPYGGDVCKLTYNPEEVSRNFRAEALRLQREYNKSKARTERLIATAVLVVAEDGTLEAAKEDEEAEAAIEALKAEDDRIEYQLEAALAVVVNTWDTTYTVKGTTIIPIWRKNAEGKREPDPELRKVPAEFKAEILNAILTDVSPGEANGRQMQSNSNSGSKQKEKPVTSLRRPTGLNRSKRRAAGRK